jgi:bisphosphoglycerate-dependent phosphoglycerate mutase
MTDIPLTEDGVKEARAAGHLLAVAGVNKFDVVYTSLLRRSTKTVWLAMQELGTKDSLETVLSLSNGFVRRARMGDRY